jgi:hypothetical protein
MTSVGIVFELHKLAYSLNSHSNSQNTGLALDTTSSTRHRCSRWRSTGCAESGRTRSLRRERSFAGRVEGRVKSSVIWTGYSCSRDTWRERSKVGRRGQAGCERTSNIAASTSTGSRKLFRDVEYVFVQVSSLDIRLDSPLRVCDVRLTGRLHPAICQQSACHLALSTHNEQLDFRTVHSSWRQHLCNLGWSTDQKLDRIPLHLGNLSGQ